MTNSEIDKIEGEAGNFKVTLLQKARYIDPTACTGCGVCAKYCTVSAINEFDHGLDRRAATYIKYPQAVPQAYAIDRDTCIGCGICEKLCVAMAVKYDDIDKKLEVNVGAVILAIGFQASFETFQDTPFGRYRYADFPNVLTSMQFERTLSASGPYRGSLLRPSDLKAPRKIAWLQCIGSRTADSGYCSAVCCMYAVKQAVVAKEHTEPLDTCIFYMDMRTCDKDFEKYYNRAKDAGVRFIRSKASTINPIDGTGDLMVRYVTERGEIVEERFNMVVLSLGLRHSKDSVTLAHKLGIELNNYNFVKTNSFSPVSTSKPGIYVCGVFQGPKDIPRSVTEASAAACAASISLAEARNTLAKEKVYPPEKDVSQEEPRIGVFICY